MFRKIKNWIFGETFTDGVQFASECSKEEVDFCLQVARRLNEYEEFERGMEYQLEHRGS